jgi:hypothetical protein
MLRVPATGSAALQMLKAAWQLLDKSDGGSAFRNFVQGLFAGARGYPLIELWRFTFKPQAVIPAKRFSLRSEGSRGWRRLNLQRPRAAEASPHPPLHHL